MMKTDDLISREGYKKVIDEQLRVYDPDSSPWHVKILELQREILDSMPAVDAVPVVRCRDCKGSYENARHIDLACEWSSDPDFYCAAGERRDDDG